MIQGTHFGFGIFRLDPDNAQLWRGTVPVTLRPRSFAVLTYLLENPDRLITKDEILEAVWPQRFVSEGVLKVCINEIRSALEDNAREPRYIQTVSRRGYRFVAEVKLIVDSAEAGSMQVANADPARAANRVDYSVGRKEVLQQLSDALTEASSGARRVMFVTGEAGIGKSTLIGMFLDRVAGREMNVLHCRCVERFGADEAFLPLVEALVERCRSEGGSRFKAELARIAPAWLAQMPWVCTTTELETLPHVAQGTTRQRMLQELCEALESLSRAAQLLLIVDDLHWSDYATLDLLSLLAHRPDPARLLILGTYRKRDIRSGEHPLRRMTLDLQTHGLCTEVSLAPLSLAEVKAYLAVRFAGRIVPDASAEEIFRRGGGHPFVTSNLVTYLLDAGLWHQSHEHWVLVAGTEELQRAVPESVRQVVEHELDRMSGHEQRIVAAASAAGAHFSAALLANALDMNCLAVEECCEDMARRTQFLYRVGVDESPEGYLTGRYAFRHALYQEASYQRLAPAQRVHLHLRLGQHLERSHGQQAGGIAPALARHFELGRDWSRSIQYLRLAAQNSARRFAGREAIAYLVRALALVARLPANDQPATRIGLLQQRAAARMALGDLQGASQDLHHMLTVARKSGDPTGQSAALVDLSRILLWLDRRRCLEFAAEAADLHGELNDEVMQTAVRANHAMLQTLMHGGQPQHRCMCLAAHRFARRTGAPMLLRPQLELRVLLANQSSRYRLACRIAEDALQASEGLCDSHGFALLQLSRIWALIHLGQWGKALSELETGASNAIKNGDNFGARICWLLKAWLHTEALDFEAAHKYCVQMSKASAQDPDPVTQYLYPIVLARAYQGLGERSKALACYGEIDRELERAESCVDWHFRLIFHQAFGDFCLTLRDAQGARKQAAHLCEKAGRTPDPCYVALGHRLLAEIAVMEEEWEAARVHLAIAAHIIETRDVPLAAWRVLATAERLYRQRGERTTAERNRQRRLALWRQFAESLEEGNPVHQSLHRHLRGTASVSASQPKPQ